MRLPLPQYFYVYLSVKVSEVRKTPKNMRLQVSTAVKIWTVIFRVVILCNHSGDYQVFKGNYCLHLHCTECSLLPEKKLNSNLQQYEKEIRSTSIRCNRLSEPPRDIRVRVFLVARSLLTPVAQTLCWCKHGIFMNITCSFSIITSRDSTTQKKVNKHSLLDWDLNSLS
jgi:hypothetical protein